jgi:hypothetical protein
MDFDIEQLKKEASSGSPGARPFGAAKNDEDDAIRAELIAEG